MRAKNQDGFTYLGILIAIVIIGVVLARTGIGWSQSAQRENERQLLFVGSEFRQAIGAYYERTPGAVKRYPRKLADLIEDRRYNPPQHYLRKLYVDPFIRRPEWGLVIAPDGGIMGVHSLFDGVPLKRAGFDQADQLLAKAKKYSDWVFSYDPNAPGAPSF